MLVNKITTGFVVQKFDTETGKFVSQHFTAGCECDYEEEDGTPLNGSQLGVEDEQLVFDAYLPFDMIQPD